MAQIHLRGSMLMTNKYILFVVSFYIIHSFFTYRIRMIFLVKKTFEFNEQQNNFIIKTNQQNKFII